MAHGSVGGGRKQQLVEQMLFLTSVSLLGEGKGGKRPPKMKSCLGFHPRKSMTPEALFSSFKITPVPHSEFSSMPDFQTVLNPWASQGLHLKPHLNSIP